MRRPLTNCPLLIALAMMLAACGARTLTVARDDEPTQIGPRPERDSGPTTPTPTPEAGVMADAGDILILCSSGPCACNDGIDNDGDGRIDGYDPECTGPFDADEGSFGTGLPTGGRGKCQDCFFDNNASSVDDGCERNRSCLLGEPPGNNDRCGCEVSAACVNTCRARTPNGCDCFGCCHVYDAGGQVRSVQLSEGCTQANLDDAKRCEPCERDETCVNPCGPCELCPGRAPDQLPASCQTGTTGQEPAFGCDDGRVCDEKRPCQDGFYCLQGCCIPVLF